MEAPRDAMSDYRVARRVHLVALALIVAESKIAFVVFAWRLQHSEVRCVNHTLLVHVFDEQRS